MLPVTLQLLGEARGLMPPAMRRPTGLLVEGPREVNVLRPRVTLPPAGVAVEEARVPSEAALVDTTGPVLALPAAAVPRALDPAAAAAEAARVGAEAGADELLSWELLAPGFEPVARGWQLGIRSQELDI
jgi:hypothetical protein